MRWDDVKHQESALARLRQSMASGRFPHALIFAGPDGVGKRLAALRVARGLLCPSGSGASDPSGCGACPDCAAVAKGSHLDLHMVHRLMSRFHPDKAVRQRKSTELSVDVIRHFLIEPIGNRPMRGRCKVFIVEEAEKLNDSARNALLKTLEEPPGSSHIILLATSEDRLSETIRSRCQVIRFGRMPDGFVREHLTLHKGVSSDQAAFLAYLAEGRVGVAAALADAGVVAWRDRVSQLPSIAAADPPMFSREAQEIVRLIAAGEATEAADESSDTDDNADDEEEETATPATKSAGDSSRQREARRLMLAMLSAAYRDQIRAGANAPLGQRATVLSASAAIRAIAEAEAQFDASVNAALVFDGLGIKLARGR